MKTGTLASFIILSTVVLFILSITAQATEYREVKAEEILNKIENGEDVNYQNCLIVGEFDINKIKLKEVSNPSFYKFLHHVDVKENLSVISSKISIENSIFANKIDFSDVFFDNSAKFSGVTFNNDTLFDETTFNNDTLFDETTFNNRTDFVRVTFNNRTSFSDATFNNDVFFQDTKFYNTGNFFNTTFNNDAAFSNVTFNAYAAFSNATFYDNVSFSRTTFKGDVSFSEATFKKHASFHNTTFNNADFSYATFINSVNFRKANFNNYSNFFLATFNVSADFKGTNFSNYASFVGPDTSENIITDGKACEFFRKSYNLEARYTDADNIYYSYRLKSMNEESISVSKGIDFLSWITCGFGTKLEYTILWIIGIIILFAFVYKWDWKTPGIYRASEEDKKENANVSFWECLCFSVNTFTRLGTPYWHQRDKFWYAVTIEGVFGWVMLAIFLATLMHLLIRP